MAFNKRTWKGRQGTGLNKFSIDGATPVTVVNQPDSITEQGDALSAGNLNDLEDRIYDAFDDIADGTQVVGKATADASGNVITTTYATKSELTSEATARANADSNLLSACEARDSALNKRVTNLEQKAGDEIIVDYPSPTYGMDEVPANVAEYGKVSKLRGVSRVENSLIPTLDNFSVYHCTKSVSGGVATISGFSGSDAQLYKSSVPMPIGQTALGAVSIKPSKSTMIRVSIGYANIIALVTLTANVWTNLANVLTVPGSAGNEFAIWLNVNGDLSTSDTVEVKSAIYSNLSVYFAGDPDVNVSSLTIADIQKDYPHLLIPSDYGTRIVDSSYSAVKSVGVNIWDEEWELGGINATTGATYDNNQRIRSKNYIRMLSNADYYFYLGSGSLAVFACYDANHNFLGDIGYNAENSVIHTPVGTVYGKFQLSQYYGTTYKHDVTIARGSTAVTYHPYKTATLTFPSPVSLKSAGTVAEEYYPESGRVTHPIGQMDLGTASWYYDVNYSVFIGTIAGMKFDASNIYNCICSKYVNSGIASATSPDKTFYPRNAGIGIKDSAYTSVGSASDPTTFLGSLQGVMLYYELATPSPDTYVDPLPDPFVKVEGGGTIRPTQSQTTKIDSSMTAEYLSLGANA